MSDFLNKSKLRKEDLRKADLDWLHVLKAVGPRIFLAYLGCVGVGTFCAMIAGVKGLQVLVSGWFIGLFAAVPTGIYLAYRQRYFMIRPDDRRRRIGIHDYDFYKAIRNSTLTTIASSVVFIFALIQMFTTSTLDAGLLRIALLMVLSGASLAVILSNTSH